MVAFNRMTLHVGHVIYNHVIQLKARKPLHLSTIFHLNCGEEHLVLVQLFQIASVAEADVDNYDYGDCGRRQKYLPTATLSLQWRRASLVIAFDVIWISSLSSSHRYSSELITILSYIHLHSRTILTTEAPSSKLVLSLFLSSLGHNKLQRLLRHMTPLSLNSPNSADRKRR